MHRPRLYVVRNAPATIADALAALRTVADIVEFGVGEEIPVGSPTIVPSGTTATALTEILQHLPEGIGMVSFEGDEPALRWCNDRLAAWDDAVRAQFVAACRMALEGSGTAPPPSSRRFAFAVGEAHFEALVASTGTNGSANAAIGVLWETTASRRLQSRLDAIDAAGSDLLRIEASMIQRLNAAERLRLFQERIVATVRNLLHFDHFEVRLIDRHTNRLELVFAHGLQPLRIGECLYASDQGNGISGWVAVHGRPYRCEDVLRDPLYREGLAEARSTLTVPLRLHDQVIGVFNVESARPGSFSAEDERFTELLGRYIAMAMHILDLLVVERFTTNEQVAANVLAEIRRPIERIAALADAAREHATRPTVREDLHTIVALTAEIRRRVEACTTGPKSLLGAQEEDDDAPTYPGLVGKRILLCDNETAVLEAMKSVLERRGCLVDAIASGVEVIERLDAPAARTTPYDLVISDIRMPDRSGYEVFRAAKAACADTPVMLMTSFGYDPHHSIVRASQEGLHSFLFKPIRTQAFVESVAKAVGAAE